MKLSLSAMFGVLLWLMLVSVILAQSPFGQPSWEEGLRWAVGPGAAIVAGIIISVLVEYWPGFQALGQKWMVLVYLCLSLAVTCGATALAITTGVWGAWGDIAGTWWPAIWAGLAAAGVGTLFHAWAPMPLRRD